MPWDIRAWHERLERLSTHNPEAWSPSIDVYETSEAFVVTAELPGVTRDQIDLALEASRLSLRGQRIEQYRSRDVLHFHQIERGYGSFVRTFEFANKIDVEHVTADLTDGVLTITLPKVPAEPARRISVK
jgi:HSP20 family protein